ncbi:hypothetical protein [Caudoviricetes sp.]|nr:hypothetical protein [Caudoviricetes sp.]
MDLKTLGSLLGGGVGAASAATDEYAQNAEDRPSYITSLLKPALGGAVGRGLAGLGDFKKGIPVDKKEALMALLKKMAMAGGATGIMGAAPVALARKATQSDAERQRLRNDALANNDWVTIKRILEAGG